METIVSTKILTETQQSVLLGLTIQLIEHNFISVNLLSIKLTLPYNLLIFTSQNAVKSVLQHPLATALKNSLVLCVGERTAQLLEKSGFTVCCSFDYATDLTKYLSANLKEFEKMHRIAFFAGTQRLETLPQFFAKHLPNVEEITAYQTELTPITIHKKVDGILFFSPSGVESYHSCNPAGEEKVFCIGDTTAEAAQRYWKDVVIAEKPTIDSVLAQVRDMR